MVWLVRDQVIAVFPCCLMWFYSFPVCLGSCFYPIIKSVFLSEMGCLFEESERQESFSPSPPVLLRFLSIFFLFTNCFLNVPFALPCRLLAPLLVFSHPSFSSHLYGSMCVSLGVPDNLSEVLLKLMRGDSIRLQTPLINLSRSSCIVHANDLFKCVTGADHQKEKRECV